MQSSLAVIWILLGVVLLVIEQAFPAGFFVFFFGAAAIVTGLLTSLDLLPNLVSQLVCLIVIALGLVFYRKPLVALLNKGATAQDDTDTPIGGRGMAVEALEANGGRGKVEFRGSTWSAKNIGETALVTGERFKVVSLDGLVLNITKE